MTASQPVNDDAGRLTGAVGGLGGGATPLSLD
jgi:hypothetical protein